MSFQSDSCILLFSTGNTSKTIAHNQKIVNFKYTRSQLSNVPPHYIIQPNKSNVYFKYLRCWLSLSSFSTAKYSVPPIPKDWLWQLSENCFRKKIEENHYLLRIKTPIEKMDPVVFFLQDFLSSVEVLELSTYNGGISGENIIKAVYVILWSPATSLAWNTSGYMGFHL